MKKSLFLILGSILVCISCRKNNPESNNNLYLNTTPGSTWQYQLADTTNGVGVDTLVTFTSSAPDTIMVGKVIIYIRTHYLHSMIM